MKHFIEVKNNYDLEHGETSDYERKEIIPIDNLVKVYKHIGDIETIAYVFTDPVTGFDREWFEALPPALFDVKWKELARQLTGQKKHSA